MKNNFKKQHEIDKEIEELKESFKITIKTYNKKEPFFKKAHVRIMNYRDSFEKIYVRTGGSVELEMEDFTISNIERQLNSNIDKGFNLIAKLDYGYITKENFIESMTSIIQHIMMGDDELTRRSGIIMNRNLLNEAFYCNIIQGYFLKYLNEIMGEPNGEYVKGERMWNFDLGVTAMNLVKFSHESGIPISPTTAYKILRDSAAGKCGKKPDFRFV